MRIVVNPKAGHGRFSRHRKRLQRALDEKGIAAEFVETLRPGHATDIAREAMAEGLSRLVVMGGDGTISEVANGLAKSDVALGIVPSGTGNDVARTFGLPIGDPVQALERILSGSPRQIDLGYDGKRYFLSVLGVGFPTKVAMTANSFTHLRGPLAFFFATYRELLRMRAVPMSFKLDDRLVEMNCTSVMVQNTRFTGGGLMIAPHASTDDGFLDVVLVDDIGRLSLMVNFPKVYLGRHLAHPSFYSYRVKTIEIMAPGNLEMITDGDFSGLTPARVEVVEKALTLIV